jgi:hypothetical protein
MRVARKLLAAGAACCAAAAVSVPGGQAAAAGVARFVGPVHVVTHGRGVNTNQSSNWSGYNIGIQYPQVRPGTVFTKISGEWTVPKATQHTKGQTEDSASWVGIGGGCIDDTCAATDETLIQAGTEQDVSSAGKASYGAWWELIPRPETAIRLPVHPGNVVKVTISQTSAGDWKIVIRNITTGRSFTKTTAYSSSRDTAEWIEETPLEVGTGSSGLAHLPNLGSVKFRDATLNGANPGFRPIDEMQLSNNGKVLATPSAPNAAHNGFNDCTYKRTCAAP